jgi:hypothetical protein
MGNIYTNAQCVYLWFGNAPYPNPIRETLRSYGPDARYTEEQKSLTRAHFVANPYWTRAWITQEVGLARKIMVVSTGEVRFFSTFLHAMQIDGSTLLGSVSEAEPIPVGSTTPMSPFAGHYEKAIKGALLTKLLSQLRAKQCSIRRDRIYSLLGLCVGGNQFPVDYDVPEIEIFMLVLKHCEANLCFCTVALLVEVLGLRDTEPVTDTRPPFYPYIEFRVDYYPVKRPEARLERCAWDNNLLNWHMDSNEEGKLIVARTNGSSAFTDAAVEHQLSLAGCYEVQKKNSETGDWSVRMPLLVWARWIQKPVKVCIYGTYPVLQEGEPTPIELCVGYVDSARGVDVRAATGLGVPKTRLELPLNVRVQV